MKVAVVMGSKSDMSVVGKTLETLGKFEIPFEARVIGASVAGNRGRVCKNRRGERV